MSIYIDTRVTNYLYTLFSVCFSMVKTIIKPVHLQIICTLIILFVLVISYNDNNAKLITASKLKSLTFYDITTVELIGSN